jgi:hypothetical protein
MRRWAICGVAAMMLAASSCSSPSHRSTGAAKTTTTVSSAFDPSSPHSAGYCGSRTPRLSPSEMATCLATAESAAPPTTRPTATTVDVSGPHTMEDCMAANLDAAGLDACERNASDYPTTASTAAPLDTLKVTGTGSALMTYTAAAGTAQVTAPLPWSVQVPPADFIGVSAQLQNGGTVTCTIIGPGGDVLSTVTSSGDYVIADCHT